MIDPSIILAGRQTASPFDSAAQGIQFGQGLRQLLSGRQVGKLQQIQSSADRQAFANKSMFSRELNAQIKADEATALQAQMVQQKHAADIENTKAQAAERNSNVGKNIQQGVGYGLDNSGKLLAAADKALMYAAQSGDPMAAKLALNNAYKAGSITPELYQQYSNQIDVLGNNPDELKNFAGNLIFAGAKDPASLLYQDANNAATNATAQRGQDISAETSRYGTDVSANTAAARLAQDGQQFGATMEFNKSQTSPLFAVQQKDIADGKAKLVDVNGVTYLDYGDGNGEIYVDKGGQPAKAQAKAAKGISKLSDKALIQVNEANTQLLQANQNYKK